ncbi:MAG: CotH kinase family protein [Cyclobacteriaceae bacterium]|nr:CotH kinase family protein [Cyclobacteriaceae bacterium]
MHHGLVICIFLIAQMGLSQTVATQSLDTVPLFPEIQINISANQFNKLKSAQGVKLELKDAQMILNEDTAKVDNIHIRGNNSLNFKRKSFSVDLDKSVVIRTAQGKTHVKKFLLLSLIMDKNLWHSRWAFLMMNELSLFPLFNSFCTVSVNNEPQGIYLLVEKPHQATTRLKSTYMVRRGLDHKIDTEYDDTNSKEQAKLYRKQYYSLYNTANLHGDSLLSHLNKSINLHSYFSWIGFNYLTMNGDYSDELFLYINPSTGLYEAIGWDYDDLFRMSPHEGQEVRKAQFGEKMIFSLEDSFDRMIAADPVVYSSYLKSLKNVLTICDSTLITTTSQRVLNELDHLNKNEAQRKATLYIDKEEFDIDKTHKDIKESMSFLLTRRRVALKKLSID